MLTIRNYKRAESLEEAWTLNQKRGAVVLGGMLWLKMGKRTVQTAVDLSGLGLDRIKETPEGWEIGCMATLRQLEFHEGLNAYTGGALREAVGRIVGVQFRNLATVGGSVWGRFGFSDVCTVLLTLDSSVELYKGGTVPLRDFLARERDRDILVSVLVPKRPGRFCYQSVRNSRTDFPVLACAAALVPAEGGQRLRLSVGARPGRAVLYEDGQVFPGPISEAEAEALGARAAAAVPTGDNLRGSAAYRSHLIQVLAARAAIKLGGAPEC